MAECGGSLQKFREQSKQDTGDKGEETWANSPLPRPARTPRVLLPMAGGV